MLNQQVIDSRAAMDTAVSELAQGLLQCEPVPRGPVHAQATDEKMLELNHMTLVWSVDTNFEAWQETMQPNLPWAEDHFQERISGEPLNPPPSEAYWPFAQQGNAVHKEGQIFSHTYPERFWPRHAASQGFIEGEAPSLSERYGIRFRYGDLADLVQTMGQNPMTRQAYLPVWFPEDLAAAREGKRVPCTLGYHFLQTGPSLLDCAYFMRSCDLVRFFRDDVYMAGRLLHYVCAFTGLVPGNLVVHISNLHAFEGDKFWLNQQVPKAPAKDKRSNYRFDQL
jgi:hypothetical protein